MKKVAVILFLSLVSLSNVSAMNVEHGGRGSYGGGGFHRGFHTNYNGGFHTGFYGNTGYRSSYYRGGYHRGFYGARVCVPIWVPGYWIYDNYGNQIQWVNGYYR